MEYVPDDIKNLCKITQTATTDDYRNTPKIPHKDFIRLVRNMR